MKKKIANQISLPIITISVIAIVAAIISSSVIVKQIINEQLDQHVIKAKESFYGNADRLLNNTIQLAAILSSNQNTKNAFIAYNQSGDLENSVTLLKEDFQKMNSAIIQADYKNFRIHYHSNNIRSFYRSWTEKRGDDLTFRNSIKKCIGEKKPIKGIEAGRGGVAFRGIMPVIDENGMALGSVENYVEVNEFMKSVKVDTLLENYAIFLRPELTEIIDKKISSDITKESTFIGNFVMLTSTNKQFNCTFLKEENLIEGTKTSVKLKERNYLYTLNPLYDFEGNSIGSVVYQYDLREINNKSSNLLLLFIIVGSILAILIFIIITFLVRRILGKPISLIKNQIKQISNGDLTGVLKISSNNEIGDVSDDLNAMTGNLKVIVGNILTESNVIANMSQKMNDASVDISKGSTNQASSIEEVSSSMEEISSNMHYNYENAKQTEKIALLSAKNIREGNHSAESLVESMNGISEKISIINDIAFQTNILALNAAVEAARAGDHGRGFAVVASEVRKLAERSKDAASDISSIISKGVQITKNVGLKLGEIVPEIEKTANLIQEISISTQEINTGSQQVNNAMQQLNEVTQLNASGAEEMAQMSVELANQAEVLKKLVLSFKI